MRAHSFPGDFPVGDIPVRARTPIAEARLIELRDAIHANWGGPVRDGIPDLAEGESWVVTTGITNGGCVYQKISRRALIPTDLPVEVVVYEP